MAIVPKKSRLGFVLTFSAIAYVVYVFVLHIGGTLDWSPDAYEDPRYLNLTSKEFRWEVRYGDFELCGQLFCAETPPAKVESRVLPNPDFGAESTAADRVLKYSTEVALPVEWDRRGLGIHFLHLFSDTYEFYVNGKLAAKGRGIETRNLPLPRELLGERQRVRLDFKIGTKGIAEPGFDIRAHLLIGPLAELDGINRQKREKDHRFVLWMTMPRLVVVFMFGFGAWLFAYSREYALFCGFALASALRVPVFFGEESIFWIPWGLSRADMTNILDVTGQLFLFAFVYRYFRQEGSRVKGVGVAMWALGLTGFFGSMLITDSQTSHAVGRWIGRGLQFCAMSYGAWAAARVYLYLRGKGLARSRELISLTMALAFLGGTALLVGGFFLLENVWTLRFLVELGIAIVFAACVSTDLGKVRGDRDSIRRKFGIHVDEGIVKELLESSDFISRKVESAAILFIDIRSFTSLCGEHGAEAIMELLNEYFHELIECVHGTGGVVNKFMGDSLMGVWGVTGSVENPGLEASRAALAMRRRLRDLNHRRRREGKFEIAFGIAVHVGPVIAGHIGDARRAEYSVVGGAVNVAARFEGLSSRLKRDIVISAPVLESVAEWALVADIGSHDIRGVAEPMQAYALIGMLSEDRSTMETFDDRWPLSKLPPEPGVLYGSGEPPKMVVPVPKWDDEDIVA